MSAVPLSLPNAFYPLPAPGYLRLTGADRRVFLQRQTTNHIDLLAPERSLLTVLTSPTARILDVLILLDEGEFIGILTLPGSGVATYRYLRSRIFFNDKVSIHDDSEAWMQIDLFGPESASAVEGLGMLPPAEANTVYPGPDGARLLRLEPAFSLGFRLLLPAAAASQTEAVLSAGLERLSTTDYDRLRIERGLPAAGGELTEDYTPLEAGLSVAVSNHKGCYTGQEIIARQITYDKVTRLLCGLRLSAAAEPGADLAAADGSPAGKLTSVANSPHLGWIGLGIVKRPYHQPGNTLRISGAGASITAATVDAAHLDADIDQ